MCPSGNRGPWLSFLCSVVTTVTFSSPTSWLFADVWCHPWRGGLCGTSAGIVHLGMCQIRWGLMEWLDLTTSVVHIQYLWWSWRLSFYFDFVLFHAKLWKMNACFIVVRSGSAKTGSSGLLLVLYQYTDAHVHSVWGPWRLPEGFMMWKDRMLGTDSAEYWK